jgi:hypothetical protein
MRHSTLTRNHVGFQGLAVIESPEHELGRSSMTQVGPG